MIVRVDPNIEAEYNSEIEEPEPEIEDETEVVTEDSNSYGTDESPRPSQSQSQKSNPVDIFNDDDNDDDYGNDNNNNNNKEKHMSNCGGEPCTDTEKEDSWTDDEQPYCDEIGTPNHPVGCWDRKDYSQETGLYPCKDGSYVEDWRDCD